MVIQTREKLLRHFWRFCFHIRSTHRQPERQTDEQDK